MAEDNSNRGYRRRYDSQKSPEKMITRSSEKHIHLSSSKSPSGAGELAALMGAGGKLAQEIEEELLNCKICLGPYKQPKSLGCLHTFCADCLESHIQGEVTYKKYSDYREFTCPLCRKRTTLPIGGVRKLPDNFVVVSLCEMINRRKASVEEDESSSGNGNGSVSGNLRCQICASGAPRPATTKCLDCSKLLCRQCTETHRSTKVTKQHALFDIKIEEEIICKVHPDESVRFFCEPCQTCICVLCTFHEHKEHDVLQFQEAVAKYKAEIEARRELCAGTIGRLSQRLTRVEGAETVIKATEDSIGALASKLVDDIRLREKQLLEEIRNMYGESLLRQIGSKASLGNQLSELQSAHGAAGLLLQRRDVELLLQKREVQARLEGPAARLENMLNEPLPDAVDKVVHFVPGVLEFGCIQDMDRPMLTRPRSVTMYYDTNRGSYETETCELHDIECQTDPAPAMLSKSVATAAVETANKAINTRTRVVPSSIRSNSVCSMLDKPEQVSPLLEVRPITSTEAACSKINPVIQVNSLASFGQQTNLHDQFEYLASNKDSGIF